MPRVADADLTIGSRRAERGERRVPLWVPLATLGLIAVGLGARRTGRDQAEARKPWQRARKTGIPGGLKSVLPAVFRKISEDRVLANAAGVTYFVLLALFPAIAALVSIYALYADAATIERQLVSLSYILPGGAIEIIGEQVQRIAAQGSSALGISFLAGLLISLWSANSGAKALFDALSIVYGVTETRSFIKLNLISLAFTIGGIVFILVAIAAIVGVPIVMKFVGLAEHTELLLTLARWPVLFLVVAAVIALIYRYGPDRRDAIWRWITWGSAFASLMWIGASLLFSWYAGNFGSYNETYGSLGAVIGFMTWIWISAIVVLVGAALDAELERRSKGEPPRKFILSDKPPLEVDGS
jgi:membrane protein